MESIDKRLNSYRLMDVNQDGILDIILWYRKIQDGTNPDILKMFLFVQGKKYGLRGRIPKFVSDLELYEKTMDLLGQAGTQALRDPLESEWEILVKPEIEELQSNSQE